MRYKIGDVVRIVSSWNDNCGQNMHGRMDHWLGKTMTIRDIGDFEYKMEEDIDENGGDGWYWNDWCIEGYADDPDQAEPSDVLSLIGA